MQLQIYKYRNNFCKYYYGTEFSLGSLQKHPIKLG